MGSIGFYWVLLGLTGFYWVFLQWLTGLNPVKLDIVALNLVFIEF